MFCNFFFKNCCAFYFVPKNTAVPFFPSLSTTTSIETNIESNFLNNNNNNNNKLNYTFLWENSKPFIPPITGGIVIKVYDGDTITIATSLPDSKNLDIYRFSVRLRGIDAPEMKSTSEKEKELASKSQIALSNLILGKSIELKNVGVEKYGRVLADVYFQNIHINNWMLENKLAVPYFGKKKIKPLEWM